MLALLHLEHVRDLLADPTTGSSAGSELCARNRNVFPLLTVRQNLLLGIKDMRHPSRWSIEQMLQIFSSLQACADSPAGVLSGSEKQMLITCRTLMEAPALIMAYEPTEGWPP
ncbi:MAG: hypothetical protein GDA41_03375 [Rhodospirillales bacterium]|nr:hypothetical protein [Rhodospirillales bacterium]